MVQSVTKIYIIGARACGKTRLGKALAKKLCWDFVDTDAHIQQEAHCSVAEYVQAHGWEGFRDLESSVLHKISASQCIVATGGGMVLREENRIFMRKTGHVVFLQVPVSILVQRLTSNPEAAQRPSLTGKGLEEEVAEIVQERLPLYTQTAHTTLDGTQRIAKLVRKISAQVK